MPVGPARIWSSCLKIANNEYQNVCRNSLTTDDPWNRWFYKRSTSVIDYQEHFFIRFWLENILPADETLVQIRSGVHVGGRVTFELKSQPDIFVITEDDNRTTHVYVVHYDGTYWLV